jgi:hypothetical protein
MDQEMVMFRRKKWSAACACGEPFEAMSREGLQGLLRTHVLFDHKALQPDPIVEEEDWELEPMAG